MQPSWRRAWQQAQPRPGAPPSPQLQPWQAQPWRRAWPAARRCRSRRCCCRRCCRPSWREQPWLQAWPPPPWQAQPWLPAWPQPAREPRLLQRPAANGAATRLGAALRAPRGVPDAQQPSHARVAHVAAIAARRGRHAPWGAPSPSRTKSCRPTSSRAWPPSWPGPGGRRRAGQGAAVAAMQSRKRARCAHVASAAQLHRPSARKCAVYGAAGPAGRQRTARGGCTCNARNVRPARSIGPRPRHAGLSCVGCSASRQAAPHARCRRCRRRARRLVQGPSPGSGCARVRGSTHRLGLLVRWRHGGGTERSVARAYRTRDGDDARCRGPSPCRHRARAALRSSVDAFNYCVGVVRSARCVREAAAFGAACAPALSLRRVRSSSAPLCLAGPAAVPHGWRRRLRHVAGIAAAR